MQLIGNKLVEQVQEIEELRFLIQQNLQIGKVPIGNCYAQKQRLFSTQYIDFLTSGTTLVAGTTLDFFNYSSGASLTSSGGSTAHFSFTSTDCDTNWPAQSNALGVNQMFLGYKFGIDLGLAASVAGSPFPTSTVIGSNLGGLPTAAAADQFARSATYAVLEGGQIKSQFGLALDYPSGVGISAASSYYATVTTPGLAHRDIAVENGGPGSDRKDFNIPQLWKPLVNYQHRITINKAAVLVDGITGYSSLLIDPRISESTSALIRVRLSWDGFLITGEA